MAGLVAVVPIAGLGTRMRPWSYSCSKAFLPLLQRRADGSLQARSAIDLLLSDLLERPAAVTRVCVVVSPSQEIELNRALMSFPSNVTSRVCVSIQTKPLGFGDAVLAAKKYLPPNKAFFVALGDHVFTAKDSNTGGSGCLSALFATWQGLPEGSALTAAGTCALDEVVSNGLLSAEEAIDSHALVVTQMAEKPQNDPLELQKFSAPRPASKNPSTLHSQRFVCNFGIDLLPWDVMDILEHSRKQELYRRSLGHEPREVGLREAQAVLQRQGRLYLQQLEPEFARHDIGNPEAYWKAMQHFANAPPLR
jgi:UTP-glucose-1-phosphate uridylyltransferase